MPTLPSTFVPLDPDDVLISGCGVSDCGDALTSPTPDPDEDDVVLVSVLTGDGVGAITSVSNSPCIYASLPTSISRPPV